MDIKAYWDAAARQDAAAMRLFFHPEAIINWHQTNERFTLEEFIRANCEYPGSWEGRVERVEDLGERLITAVHVWSNDTRYSAFGVSFFTLKDGLITALDEYWGDEDEAPAWRRDMGIGRSIRASVFDAEG